MRSTLLVALLAAPALASWFGSDEPQPTNWSQEQLQKAQQVYGNVKDDAFATWDESRLRQFLLDQGVIEPKGTKEQLVQMARGQRKAFSSALSSYSKAASTAVYGDSYYQATQSLSSVASRATDSVIGTMDDSRDYVYSTWSDNQLRSYLEENGYIRTQQQVTRDEMLKKMKDTYYAAANPVYEGWSDSYIRQWLLEHGVITPPATPRDKLIATLSSYYYSSKDFVWSSWSDSDLHAWLVKHNVIRSEAEVSRDKMLKLVKDNYYSASNAVWDAWTESEMREWLIDHGYMRSDAQVKRDEIKAMINEKYTNAADRTAEYLTWPDARLRAYLRQHGLPESQLPTTRPGLLHEVRIRYVMTQNRVDELMQKIRDAVSHSVESAETTLHSILGMLSGAKNDAEVKRREAVAAAEKKASDAQEYANSLKAEATKMAHGEL